MYCHLLVNICLQECGMITVKSLFNLHVITNCWLCWVAIAFRNILIRPLPQGGLFKVCTGFVVLFLGLQLVVRFQEFSIWLLYVYGYMIIVHGLGIGVAQWPRPVAQCPRWVAQCPTCDAQCPRCVAQCSTCVVQSHRCVAKCPRYVVRCNHFKAWSIGSMGWIGGADRTFACKSQECLWQDWYIYIHALYLYSHMKKSGSGRFFFKSCQ